MKILLVNNNTLHLTSLKRALRGHELEVVNYQPGVTFFDADKDLVVLSGGGGEGQEIDDEYAQTKLWYEDEMDFILRTKKPVLGICMGFEVIAKAYGAKVENMGFMQRGLTKFGTTRTGRNLIGKDWLQQFEFHRWNVQNISSREFQVLAESSTGVEIIKHKQRPLLATQFHPEKGGTLSVKKLITQIC